MARAWDANRTFFLPSRRTSLVIFTSPSMPWAYAGAGLGRRPPIRLRISRNRCRGAATSADAAHVRGRSIALTNPQGRRGSRRWQGTRSRSAPSDRSVQQPWRRRDRRQSSASPDHDRGGRRRSRPGSRQGGRRRVAGPRGPLPGAARPYVKAVSAVRRRPRT